jgi:trans-AT polyketide synthase/acyltransferase/oxidoreductase domain-containing protein
MKEDIALAENIFKKAGARRYIPLKVSGAFHSKYMEAARDEFYLFLE